MWHPVMDLAELNFCLARNNWGMEFFMLSVVGFKVAARVQCIIYNNLDRFRAHAKAFTIYN